MMTEGPNATHRSACVECTEGHRCDGSSNAEKCSAWQYGSNGVCRDCPSDNYYSEEGWGSCSLCASNKFTRFGGSNNHTACEDCPAGMDCSGHSNYTTCPAGTKSENGDCVYCGSDSWYSGAKASACVECAEDHFTHGNSNVNRTHCSPCRGGQSCVGNSTVSDCPQGQYAELGDGKCTECGRDHESRDALSNADKLFLDEQGMSKCKVCQETSYTN